MNRGGRSSVNPPGGEANESPMLENLRQSAQLEMKGQPVLHPSKEARGEGPAGSTLLWFRRSELSIPRSTTEIIFSVKMGPCC